MYSCECYDYSNRHIYKHIHAIHMHITQTMSTTVRDNNYWVSYQQ